MMRGSNTESPLSLGEPLLQLSLSTQELNRKHLDKLKDVTWVIKVSASKKQKSVLIYGTGFSVSHGGLIMTCAHLISNVNVREIRVRKLNENDFPHKATVEFHRPKWDMMLLRVHDIEGFGVGVLAEDGSLFENEHLLHIGHPRNFVGSILVGRVVYPCVDDVSLPIDSRICKTYRSNSLTVTPRYRVIGDVVNADSFKDNTDNEDYVDPLVQVIPFTTSNISLGYEKNLHPLIPVIQCTGLIGGEGCSGGPVFNTQGKIVGMLVMVCGGYEIAIHVTLLRKFFDDALKEIGGRLHDDAKDLKRKHPPDPSDEEI